MKDCARLAVQRWPNQGFKMRSITVVLAEWCPHCVPLTLDILREMSKELDVPLRVLDIDDPEQESEADKLVKEHGDDCEDYLIPQVFFEDENGAVRHIFTGFSESVSVTEARWHDFMASKFYRGLRGVSAQVEAIQPHQSAHTRKNNV
jgi:glutaredoxin